MDGHFSSKDSWFLSFSIVQGSGGGKGLENKSCALNICDLDSNAGGLTVLPRSGGLWASSSCSWKECKQREVEDQSIFKEELASAERKMTRICHFSLISKKKEILSPILLDSCFSLALACSIVLVTGQQTRAEISVTNRNILLKLLINKRQTVICFDWSI